MLEEKRICAFIDILGFKNEILNSDAQRREKIIKFIQRITNEDSQQSMNTENLGLGQVSYPSAEVTTFSDNIVISSNLKPIIRKVQVGNEIQEIQESSAKFVEHIFIKIIGVYWEALHLGLLFRGGITYGNLYHKNRTVVGEALITAYQLEMDTIYPRIEVTSEVVEIVNSMDEIYEKETLFIKEDNKYFVNVFGFNIGVWKDYIYYRGIEAISYKEIFDIVDNLIKTSKKTYMKHIEAGNTKVASKWKWFLDTFKKEYNQGHWKTIKNNVYKTN